MSGDRGTSYGRDNLNAQLEHLQSKYVGTGHADTKKYELISNQNRDSLASYVGHHSLLCYLALAEGNSVGRERFQLIEKMINPSGPRPPEEEIQS